jgi:hypothetical protein
MMIREDANSNQNTIQMTPDKQPEAAPERQVADLPGAGAEDRKVAARRRFLRGASGGAALVLTVPHRRAFAAKKGTLISNCTSLNGVPDLKNVTNKKALEASIMGTPKGAICRPKPPLPDPNDVGNCTPTKWSNYRDSSGNKVLFVEDGQLKKGCGSVMPNAPGTSNTITSSYNYRLYEKGYCPLVWQGDELVYKSDAKYYKFEKDVLTEFSCQMPPP